MGKEMGLFNMGFEGEVGDKDNDDEDDKEDDDEFNAEIDVAEVNEDGEAGGESCSSELTKTHLLLMVLGFLGLTGLEIFPCVLA